MDTLSRMKNPRLYIALYALDGALRENGPPGPQEYFWTFLVAPAAQDANGIRYRIKKVKASEKPPLEITEWEHDKCLVPFGRHDDIIARVLVAEVDDGKATDEKMRSVWPEKTVHVAKTGAVRTSKDWVQRITEELRGPSPYSLSSTVNITKGLADWESIEKCCTLLAKKAALGSERSDNAVPTLDMLQDKEV